MDNNGYKIVHFDQYCPRCKFKNVNDSAGEEPCNECLTNATNLYSHRPVKFVEKENN